MMRKCSIVLLCYIANRPGMNTIIAFYRIISARNNSYGKSNDSSVLGHRHTVLTTVLLSTRGHNAEADHKSRHCGILATKML